SAPPAKLDPSRLRSAGLRSLFASCAGYETAVARLRRIAEILHEPRRGPDPPSGGGDRLGLGGSGSRPALAGAAWIPLGEPPLLPHADEAPIHVLFALQRGVERRIEVLGETPEAAREQRLADRLGR